MLSTALSAAATRFMRYVETGRGPPVEGNDEGEHLSLKEQKELFGLVRGYQDSERKRQAKEPIQAPGFENYKAVLDRIIAREDDRLDKANKREQTRAKMPVVDGIAPPPPKQGRPTKAEAEHRRQYEEARARMQAEGSDGEGLQARLRAAGYGEQ